MADAESYRAPNLPVYWLFVIAAVAATVYALTFSGMSSFDSLCYYRDVEMGGWRDLVHPHHIIYLPVQQGWYRLWQSLGYDGRAVLPLKALSRLVTCSATLSIGLLLREVTVNRFQLCAMTTGFAFIYLTWHFATQAEPVPFFLLFSILNLYLLLRAMSASSITLRHIIQFGVVNSLGVLFHQELILIAPFSVIVIWLKLRTAAKARGIITYLLVICAGVVIPYLLVGKCMAGVDGLRGLLQWSSSYLGHFRSQSYGRFANIGVETILSSLARTFIGGTALKPYLLGSVDRDHIFYFSLIPFVWTGLFLGLGLVLLVIKMREALRSFHTQIAITTTIAILFGVVALWWAPYNRTFWSPVVPCILVLVSLGYGGRPSRGKWQTVKAAMFGTFIAVLVWGNLTGGILAKHLVRDESCRLLAGLQENIQGNDAALLWDSRLSRIIDYFAPDIRTLTVTTRFGAIDTPLSKEVRSALTCTGDVLCQGNRVFISSEVIGSKEDAARILQAIAGSDIQISEAFHYGDPFVGLGEHIIYRAELR